jgi:predicted phage tail protein
MVGIQLGGRCRSQGMPIANLAATGGQTNSVALSWEPDSAGTGVVGYQVYGSSTDPTVPVTPANLAGQTPEPAFQHTGLGLQQQWYYRVRALATNGQVGPISEVVTARTGNQLKIAGESLVPTAVATAPVVVQGASKTQKKLSRHARRGFRIALP